MSRIVEALALPRSQWAAHPHFPTQVLLLGSHAQFRSISRMLIETENSPERALDLFRWWKSGMHSHEAYEERKLYPYLTHRFSIDFSGLISDHNALRAAERQVFAVPDHHNLSLHHDVLMKHLDAEEALVIPALLELSRAEFTRFTRSDIQTLLRSDRPLESPGDHKAGGLVEHNP